MYLGLGLDLRGHTGSSATRGICKHSGAGKAGKARHLVVGQLYGCMSSVTTTPPLRKCRGEFNPAGIRAKHPEQAKANPCPVAFGPTGREWTSRARATAGGLG